MPKTQTYTFDEFKQALVALTIDRGLPGDMGELREHDLFPEAGGRRLLGYQVFTKRTHDLHPDMDASFCVYNKSAAEKMYLQDIARYKMLPIYSDQIEEPTIMFEGDPND